MRGQATVEGYEIKFIAVGDSSVGKTSLSNRFINGSFDPNNELTIGVEYGQRTLEINRLRIKLQIWDTAGQEDFRSLTKSYYRSSAVALVVYDCTRKNTFSNVKRWINEIHDNSSRSTVLVLVCNKIDMYDKREVSKNEGLKLAKDNDMIYIETSAKTNTNVDEIFTKPTMQLMDRIESGILDTEDCPGIKSLRKNAQGVVQRGRGGCCEC